MVDAETRDSSGEAVRTDLLRSEDEPVLRGSTAVGSRVEEGAGDSPVRLRARVPEPVTGVLPERLRCGRSISAAGVGMNWVRGASSSRRTKVATSVSSTLLALRSTHWASARSSSPAVWKRASGSRSSAMAPPRPGPAARPG